MSTYSGAVNGGSPATTRPVTPKVNNESPPEVRMTTSPAYVPAVAAFSVTLNVAEPPGATVVGLSPADREAAGSHKMLFTVKAIVPGFWIRNCRVTFAGAVDAP